jgi:hypothetical protein
MSRERAEKHWEYTLKIIQFMLQLCHILYVEAMVHGAKHQKEDDKC